MANKPIYWILCAGILQAGILHADEAPPSLELLEYLADTDTSNGQWLDPLEMKNVASNEKTDESEREHRDE